jgi:paraquat-inducible protein A
MIRIWIVLALIAASVLLPLGIFLPTVHIEMTDPLSKWIGSGFREYRPGNDEMSIFGIIQQLWHGGSKLLSAIILIFSVLFPAAKIIVLWLGTINLWYRNKSTALSRALNISDKLGKWSLLDVLVIAIVLVSLKQFPGGLSVTLGTGVWLFGAAVLLTMVVGLLLHRQAETASTSQDLPDQ